MGVCGSTKFKRKYPELYSIKFDEEKEKLLKNKIGSVNFKDLFMESLSPEFMKLFQKNENLFYNKTFLEGICKEYGLMGRTQDIKGAYKIYKNGADSNYDYLCMYRLHRIFFIDYEKFNLKKNFELDRLYLYKCYAYCPNSIISGEDYILKNINITSELEIYFEYLDGNTFDNFDEFLKFLRNNHSIFNISLNDIKLMEFVIFSKYKNDIINNYEKLDEFLEIEKENKNDMAYYESQLKYCHFYIAYSGENCDKTKVNDIFDKLINSEYYKAAYDYGKFLISEEKYDDAKKIFKLGMEKCQQFCSTEYIHFLLISNELNQFLSDYKIISHFLNNLCLHICFEKSLMTSFYYAIYYLTKHSSFKEQIKNDYNKYAIEIYKNFEIIFEKENNGSLLNNSSDYTQIDYYFGFGRLCYYGIFGLINANKEKSLNIFHKAYKLAKEKDQLYLLRINYLYMYKSRKYLFKNNKITLRKLNKTKEKLFRIYEETEESYLNSIELYNYYKLYKFGVLGNTQEKIIRFLKNGKKEKNIYHFIDFIYKEKCRLAYEKEFSTSYLNQYNILLKNEFLDNKDNINLLFKTTEGANTYKLSVPTNIQFIKVIHKLFNAYPELETKKIGTYICNANKVGLFDTVAENNLKEGSVIVIVHLNQNNNDNINNNNNIKNNNNQNNEVNNNNNLQQSLNNEEQNNYINNSINEEEQKQTNNYEENYNNEDYHSEGENQETIENNNNNEEQKNSSENDNEEEENSENVPENELEEDNIMKMMVGAIKIMENEMMKNM